MKRKHTILEENRSGEDKDKGLSDTEMELNVENKPNGETEENHKKKKTKTSPVWLHFSVKLADDNESEYAHCNYCTRFANLLFAFIFLQYFFKASTRLTGKQTVVQET